MKHSLYVGTYTTNESDGIYKVQLDLETKKSTQQLVGEIENPTYVVATENRKNIYSIAKKGSQGGLASFSTNDQGTLTLQNTYLEDGKNPCHLAINQSQTLLFSAYYHQGKLQVHSLLPDGSIGELISEITYNGSGPNKDRQDKSHIHYVGLSPDDTFLFVVDLGTDLVHIYDISDGQLTETSTYKATPGSGPRHLAFHPNGEIVYLFTELSSEVFVLSFDKDKGDLQYIQTIDSLPSSFTEENTGSAIRITPNGKFLYVGNRGFDSITTYQIGIDGTLTFLSFTSTEGEHPRDFNIDSTGKSLVVANMFTNNLVIFEIRQDTGELVNLQIDIHVPDPVSIEFI